MEIEQPGNDAVKEVGLPESKLLTAKHWHENKETSNKFTLMLPLILIFWVREKNETQAPLQYVYSRS